MRPVGVPVVGHVCDLVKGRLFHIAVAVHQYPHATAFAADDNGTVPVVPRVPIRGRDPLAVAIVLCEGFFGMLQVESQDLAVRYVDYVGIVRPEPVVDEIGNEQVFKPFSDCIGWTRGAVCTGNIIKIYGGEDL